MTDNNKKEDVIADRISIVMHGGLFLLGEAQFFCDDLSERSRKIVEEAGGKVEFVKCKDSLNSCLSKLEGGDNCAVYVVTLPPKTRYIPGNRSCYITFPGMFGDKELQLFILEDNTVFLAHPNVTVAALMRSLGQS